MYVLLTRHASMARSPLAVSGQAHLQSIHSIAIGSHMSGHHNKEKLAVVVKAPTNFDLFYFQKVTAPENYSSKICVCVSLHVVGEDNIVPVHIRNGGN